MTRWPPLPNKRWETRWEFRSRFTTRKSPFHPLTCFAKFPLTYLHACDLSSSVDLDSSFLFLFLFLTMFVLCSNGCTNKRTAIPNLNLVNKSSLDKILKVEVFVHTDGQLRVAHLILDYIPISSSFQAPKCQIKARDPCLHLINIAVPGFLNPSPRPQGVLKVEPL